MARENELARTLGLYDAQRFSAVPEAAEPFCMETIDFRSPPSPSRKFNVVLDREQGEVHHLPAADGCTRETVYYVSDYHLEFHLAELAEPVQTTEELLGFIDGKIHELVADTADRRSVLLSGGDVAHSVALTTLFYDRLSMVWEGPVIAVLGNHEMWDNHPMGTEQPRTVAAVMEDYRRHVTRWERGHYRRLLLENALYLRFADGRDCLVSEAQILASSQRDLAALCEQAALVILGGVGFTGCNPKFNASLGMYRGTITTTAEDGLLSARFRRVYEKLLHCAGEQRIVIFTHTPIGNWYAGDYNPHWIYISGHTHQNKIERRPDGTTVLSDNQIAYTDRKWYLCGFACDN